MSDSDSSNQDPSKQLQTNQVNQNQDPKLEVLVGEIIGKGEDARQEIKVGDWTLTRYGQEEEIRVRDIDLAEKLEYEDPRMIRKLIKRMILDGRLESGVLQRDAVERYESKPEIWQQRQVNEFWLTEVESVLVTCQSKTTKAKTEAQKIAKFFVLARRSLLQPIHVAQPLAVDHSTILLAVLADQKERREQLDGQLKEQREQREQDRELLREQSERFERQLVEQRAFTERVLDKVLQAGRSRSTHAPKPAQPKQLTQMTLSEVKPTLVPPLFMTPTQMSIQWHIPLATIGRAITELKLRTEQYSERYQEINGNLNRAWICYRFTREAVELLRQYFGHRAPL